MNIFYIIPNTKKDPDLQITQRICDYIEKHEKKHFDRSRGHFGAFADR